MLLCLVDVEQRPSRRFLRQLTEQADALCQKGLTLLCLQVASINADTFKEWQTANPLPFPIGRVEEKSDKLRWAAGVESLPWLILTDSGHQVTAEGFPLEELNAKLQDEAK